MAELSTRPAEHGLAVTPSDTVNLNRHGRAIYVGGDGDLSVVLAGGETVTLTSVSAGTILPLCTQRVNQTGTTANDIVVLW